MSQSGPGGYITPAALGVASAAQWCAHHKWPTSGPRGSITPVAWAVPTTLQRRDQLEVPPWGSPPLHSGAQITSGPQVAHKWAGGRHNPCRLGGPHHFTAEGTIRGGPQVGRAAT